MPLFDIKCKKCKRVHEVILDEYREVVVFNCSQCTNKHHEVLPPLVAMQPDTMWAGQNTNQGYFTSKSEYNKVLKEKNLETITHRELENVRKNVAKAKNDKKEKQLNNLISHLTNDLKDVTIDPDGNTLKERNTYVRTRNKPE